MILLGIVLYLACGVVAAVIGNYIYGLEEEEIVMFTFLWPLIFIFGVVIFGVGKGIIMLVDFLTEELKRRK